MKKAGLIILFLMFNSCFIFNYHPTLGSVQRTEWIEGKGTGYPVIEGVEIIRDQYGVVHLRARNDEDLFFGLGYAMAQDRFFQMDLFRRAARGEICALFGRIKFWKIDLLTMDKVFRALNYRERAEIGYANMPEEGKKLLEAFTRGVNRYLEDFGSTIPQYHFFKTKPVPWRPEDSLICADLFGMTMTYGQLGTEYYYTRLLRELDPAKAKDILPKYPEEAPVVIKDLPLVQRSPEMENLLEFLSGFFRGTSGLGSNNWVIAPEKSESGSAIISNDPHVPVYPFPTYWYLCHLQGGSFDTIGMMFPGLPAFGAGYNGEIAWALTNASIDHIDLFLEKVNPANPDQYLYKNEWRNFKIRREEIPLRGEKKPFVLELRESIHGPVIDANLLGRNLPITDQDQVFTVKIVDVELGKFFQGYLDLARAKNWQQFQAGLKNMSLGPVAWNHLFADKNGNIGYWLTGHVPIRPDQQGFLIRKGWTGDQDWTGYIPLLELPHSYNPQQKYLATANNKNFPNDYPYYLGTEYFSSRIIRIDEVLRSKPKFSRQDMEKLQLDTTVIPAREIVPMILKELADAEKPEVKKALKLFKEWQEQEFRASLDSSGASLYFLMMDNLVRFTYQDELKKMFTGASLYLVPQFSLEHIIFEPDNPWFDNVNTPEKETRKQIIQASIIQTVKSLEQQFGKNPQNWQWGKLSHSYFYTPMGFLPGAKRHRIGKFPREGASGTVNANEGIFLGPLGWIFVVGPTTRMIVDFADPEHLYFTATTGNSENIQSGRCGNLTEFWVKGIYQSLSTKPEEYEKNAMGKLELSP